MSLQEILEPEEELLQDSEETLLDQIGGQWDSFESEDPEDHGAVKEIRIITDQEVFQALELLRLAEMQKPEVNTTWIEQCNDQEGLTKARMAAKMRQSTLHMYFESNPT